MVFVDCSFDKEKVKKECYKLVGISNLGKGSLMGYMKNTKYDKRNKDSEFTLLELTFIHQTANALGTNRVETKTLLDTLFGKCVSFPIFHECFSSSVYHSIEGQTTDVDSLWGFLLFCMRYTAMVDAEIMPEICVPNYSDVVSILCHYMRMCLDTDLNKAVFKGRELPIEMAVLSWLFEKSGIEYDDWDTWCDNAELVFLMEILHNSWYLIEIGSWVSRVMNMVVDSKRNVKS